MWYFSATTFVSESCDSNLSQLFKHRGYQQQDAHEFMHYLLDRVHTELLLSPKSFGTTETIITGIFGGLLHSEVCWKWSCYNNLESHALMMYFLLRFSFHIYFTFSFSRSNV